MSLPDVIVTDKKGCHWFSPWIPNPVRAKCGKCNRGVFLYEKKLRRCCAVCKSKVEYRFGGQGLRNCTGGVLANLRRDEQA